MKILLADYMYKKNITIRQASIMTGVPRDTIHRIMCGQMPRMDTMEQLAAGFKIHITDLFESEFK
uniref:Helix-turn-helix domain protein n=1 Tax=Podoviridae sp. ctZ5d16 TaxID=2825257 RepID=A0A8S5Q8W0_9CAUD|nr:MAG TPA: helix-turn-helix domain protein [Podoviridae sp. ctZ5d16]